ncbi:MAG: hypothetical protein JWO67_6792 [Streptosporangiaceae bacterium]|nr:hypothetical protein [Streptosporangiaceae bacterium]
MTGLSQDRTPTAEVLCEDLPNFAHWLGITAFFEALQNRVLVKISETAEEFYNAAVKETTEQAVAAKMQARDQAREIVLADEIFLPKEPGTEDLELAYVGRPGPTAVLLLPPSAPVLLAGGHFFRIAPPTAIAVRSGSTWS